MINQHQWRNYFLALTSIGSNFAVVYALGFSNVGNRPVADFEFPQGLDINSGQAITVQSSFNKNKISDKEGELIKASQKYQYIQGKKQVDLEIRYLVGTRGDVETYLQKYTSIAPETIQAQEIHHLDGVGYHASFTQDNQAYLSSCISPRSPSNVTQKQFSSHRYQNDLTLQVGLDWLRGKSSIRDRRCLWVHLSTPIKLSDTQAAYQLLETAWSDLYQWWLPNFPPLTSNS